MQNEENLFYFERIVSSFLTFHIWTTKNRVRRRIKTEVGLPILHKMFSFNYHWQTCRMSHPLLQYATQHRFWPSNTLHSQRSKAVGPCSLTLLILPCFHPPWSSWPDRMLEWPFEDSNSTNYLTVPWRAGTGYSRRWYKLWISIQYKAQFLS